MGRIVIIAVSLLLMASVVLAGCGEDKEYIEAAFTASPLSGIAPEGVTFTDQSIGKIESWAWDFNNDGVIDSTLQNPLWTYSNPSNYTVSLTVTGPGGESKLVKSNFLEFIPCPHFADFTASKTAVQGKTDAVQFTDLSTGNITSWSWDFNSDGKIDSTVQNPSYTYKTNGTFSVTLTVATDKCEDTLTKHEYIKVSGCSG